MGHCYSNNARLNHRKVTTRYHLIDMNRSNQFWKFEPSPSIEENWNLFFGTEPPPDPLRPATHASSRSSAKGPSSRPLSRRSSVASRIQSTTNRFISLLHRSSHFTPSGNSARLVYNLPPSVQVFNYIILCKYLSGRHISVLYEG